MKNHLNIISENAKRIASAQKKLGQNFILDMNITHKIAGFAHIGSDDSVLEIGPGPGGLTLAILEKQPKQLVVIEKDDRCLLGLRELVEQYRGRCEVNIIHDDALSVLKSVFPDVTDSSTLCVEPVRAGIQRDKPVIIIANLPYNIASPLLIQFVRQQRHIKEMVLMFQKEVAQRIVAAPGNKHYGRLSIITQAFFKPTIEYHLPPSVFTPPPKVDSAVVQFTPLFGTQQIPITQLEYVTQIFFSSRRKTIGHIVKRHLSNNVAAQEILAPYLNLRPENLTVETYIRVSLALKMADLS